MIFASWLGAGSFSVEVCEDGTTGWFGFFSCTVAYVLIAGRKIERAGCARRVAERRDAIADVESETELTLSFGLRALKTSSREVPQVLRRWRKMEVKFGVSVMNA